MGRRLLSGLLMLCVVGAFAQNSEAPSKIITSKFCKDYDLSKLLATEGNPRNSPQTGVDGVFDTGYWRIQIHFEKIVRDKNTPNIYHVIGASRLKGLITPFKGDITITTVTQYDRQLYWVMDTNAGKSGDNPKYDEKATRYTDIDAAYIFYEDSSRKFTGLFSGKLSFGLHQSKNGDLLDDLGDYEGDSFNNFIYNGTWISYTTHQRKLCIWGEGKLPVPNDVSVGVSEFIIAERYQNHGWQRDKNFELADTLQYWWRK